MRASKKKRNADMPRSRIIRCDKCKTKFRPAWSDEEAQTEYALTHPGLADLPLDKQSVVCDDCYAQFMEWFHSLPQDVVDEMEREARKEANL